MKKQLSILFISALLLMFYGQVFSQVTCDDPTNVTTSDVTAYSAKTTFDKNLSDPLFLTQGGDTLNAGYGRSSSNTIRVAHRFTPAELAQYDKGYLTEVSFIPTATNTAASTYTIIIYTGGSKSGTSTFNQGTAAHTSSAITRANLTMNEWNTYVLPTPIQIDATKELWIAYQAQAGNNVQTAGYDNGPQKAELGNLIYYSNSWRLFTAAGATYTYNWCIKGTFVKKEDFNVEIGEAGFAPGSGSKTVVSQFPTTSTDISYTLGGLMMNTAYDYYVQKDCGSGNTSELLGPYSFTTLNDTWCIESFENYIVGNKIDAEAEIRGVGACWETWQTASQDATVTDEFAFQGSKAGKFVNGNNMCFNLGGKTEGSFVVEFNLYVPTSRNAYINLVHVKSSTAELGCELVFGTSTQYTVRARSTTTTFTYTHNKWIPIRFDINLQKDSVQLTVDGAYRRSWRFSDRSASTIAGTKQLYGIQFTTSNNSSTYYIDAINLPLPGSKENPLTIDNDQDLVDLANAVNSDGSYKNVAATSGAGAGFSGKYFIVTNDIDLSSQCGPTIRNWTPIGNNTRPFKGTINGAQHTVSNTYINSSTQDYQGLFGVIDNGTIDSLHLEGGKITGRNYVGGLCGALKNGTITYSTNGMAITGAQYVGGIVGAASSSTSIIAFATNSGSIAATTYYAGGIVGSTTNTVTLNNVVNAGYVSSPSTAGGIVGYVMGAGTLINYAINTGYISANTYKSAVCGRTTTAISFSQVFYDKQIFVDTETNATGLFTDEMTGTALSSDLGSSTNWTFVDDLYPAIAKTSTKSVAKLAAAPFYLDDSGTPYQTVMNVPNNIVLCTLNSVSWFSPDTLITINENIATLVCTPTAQNVFLSAQLGDNIKEVILLNKMLILTTKDTISICENQLPYMYNSSIPISHGGDTTIIYTTSYGCDSIVLLTVNAYPLPDLTIIGNSTPCYSSDVQLVAQTSNSTDTYVWSTTETTDTITLSAIQENITISVIASGNNNGTICTAYDTIKITLYPIYSHEDTVVVCAAQLPYTYGNTNVLFTDSGLQAPITLQSVHGCDSVLNVFMHVYFDVKVKDTIVICANQLPMYYQDSLFDVNTVSGDYVIPMQNATGCDTIYLVRLVVNPMPTITSFSGADSIFFGDVVTLSVQTNDAFVWSTGETNATISVSPQNPGQNAYSVYLSNSYNCLDTFTHYIHVETCGNGFPITDFENNSYETRFYGRTCWLAENLRSTMYADGQPIVGVMEYASSVYPDAAHNVSIFGRLYDWYAATRLTPNDSINSIVHIQGVCPDGWKLPTFDDYMALLIDQGFSLSDLRSVNYWLDNAGNNSSEFNMRPAGYYDSVLDLFMNLHGNTYFITMTPIMADEYETFSCGYNCPDFLRYIGTKTNGYSVRCVKTIQILE